MLRYDIAMDEAMPSRVQTLQVIEAAGVGEGVEHAAVHPSDQHDDGVAVPA